MNKYDYKGIKEEVFIAHNKLRLNPQSYIKVLEKYIGYFKGNYLHIPNTKTKVETIEGKKAYIEAIEFLKHQKPLQSLEYNEYIAKASLDHLNDIGIKGICSHEGSNGSSNDSRVSKYINWEIAIAESIDFGCISGEEILVSFLVDDGIPDRTHRDVLFDNKFNHIGIAVGYHRDYNICTIVDYIGKIVSYKDDHIINKPLIVKQLTDNITSRGINALLMIAKTKELLQRQNTCKNDEDINPFNNDPEAPEGAFKCSINKTIKHFGNKEIITIEKNYILEDATQERVISRQIKYA